MTHARTSSLASSFSGSIWGPRSAAAVAVGLGLCTLAFGAPSASAAEYRNTLTHNASYCQAGDKPGVRLTVEGVKQSSGTLRIQLYKGTKEDWLQSGRWINRIELPARAGTMHICMPAPGPGTYGVAIRHDVNNNGKTDLSTDGGGMSNNPSINIFNLGKPSYTRTAFSIGDGIRQMQITMRYR